MEKNERERPTMADPMDGFLSLQHAIYAGTPLGFHDLDANYKSRFDKSDLGSRFVFAKIVDQEVYALAIFGLEDPINGIDCYSVGYAVSERHRRHGLGLEIVNKGIEELKKAFRRTSMKSFYIDAVVETTNIPSVRFAEKLFLEPGVLIIESYSGRPSLHFKKLISVQ